MSLIWELGKEEGDRCEAVRLNWEDGESMENGDETIKSHAKYDRYRMIVILHDVTNSVSSLFWVLLINHYLYN